MVVPTPMGKNFNYFLAENNDTHAKNMLQNILGYRYNYTSNIFTPTAVREEYPPGDDGSHKLSIVKVVKPVCYGNSYYELEGDIVSYYKNRNYVTTGSNKNKHISHCRNNNTKDPFPPLQPSFYAVEEVIYGQNLLANPRPWLEERGSACCIDMIHPQNKSTSERWNQSCQSSRIHGNVPLSTNTCRTVDSWIPTRIFIYLWYAFESTIPYQTVALSGHFCWTLSHPNERGGNPYLTLPGNNEIFVPCNKSYNKNNNYYYFYHHDKQCYIQLMC
jgi:hypothetical protein